MTDGKGLIVGVVGASGYTGGELCRLLLGHPAVAAIYPASQGTRSFDETHPNLLGSGLQFVDTEYLKHNAGDLDVVFFCTPSGQAMQQAPRFAESGARVVDLSPDFRFSDPVAYKEAYGAEHASPSLLAERVYGVTEHHRAAIAAARLVANPGCYVITALLPLTPIMRAGWADPAAAVHISAVNGTTGAGYKPKQALMHAEIANSMLPYSLEGHRHAPELEMYLEGQGGRQVTVDMNTAHGPFARGIYLQANVLAHPSVRGVMSRSMLLDLLTETYGVGARKEFFIRIVSAPKQGGLNEKEYGVYPGLRNVVGSNFCHIGADYDPARGVMKIVSVTDNLIKGAAGSAIQNMNVMCGLNETSALGSYAL